MLALLLSAALLLGVGPARASPFPSPHPVYGAAVPLPLVPVPEDPRRLYVRVEDPALGERLFFLDTAFSRTTCDDDFVRDLGLTPERTCARSRGELGSVRLDRAVLPDFELGGHRIEGLRCAVRDLDATSSVASAPGRPVAGVLGANVLGRFVLEIDPAAATVRLLDPAVEGLVEGPGVLRLRRERGVGSRLRLPLQVDGRTIWPLIDTGATRTHLDARRLDLPLLTEREGLARASGPGGEAVQTFRVHEARAVQLAGRELGPLRVIDRRRPAGVPGLAGQDVLAQFRLRIDGVHRLLLAEPLPQPEP